MVVIHHDGQEIRALLAQAGLQGKIATLSPLYPLEADLPVYTELATGLLYYRIRDILSAQERARYHIVSPRDINELLEADPPAAILTGPEGDLDDAFIQFAETHHYKKLAGKSVETLYLRPNNGESH